MAVNERVQWDINDLRYGQLAPSQAARTNFAPGKASGRPDDMNWPKDFRVPVGVRRLEVPTPGPLEVERVRIVKLHRGTVSDQTVLPPNVTGTETVTIVSDKEWGSGNHPEHVLTETDAAPDPVALERMAGYDWAKGA